MNESLMGGIQVTQHGRSMHLTTCKIVWILQVPKKAA